MRITVDTRKGNWKLIGLGKSGNPYTCSINPIAFIEGFTRVFEYEKHVNPSVMFESIIKD
jgi:hypothetical protein